jgi:PAS domain S-box-containing protein
MKRLLSSVEQLQQVLHGIANGITVQDPSGKVIFVNQAAARMMNCQTPEEALEKGGAALLATFDFFDESGRPVKLADLPGRRALKGAEEPEMVISYTPRGGSERRWTAIKAMPIKDATGAVILAVNVMQDITALKRVEHELKDANERITKLLENALRVE